MEIAHIKNILETPEERPSESGLREFMRTREEMLRHGGISLKEIEKRRKKPQNQSIARSRASGMTSRFASL